MRRSLVFALFAGSAAAVGCSLFVDLDALQGASVGASDAAPNDAVADGTATADGAPTCAADTSQDPHNCGTCGHDCQGGTCTSGACDPFTFTGYQGRIGALTCDEKAVYWLLVDTANPAVWRKELGASGPGVSLFDVDDSAFDIAVDDSKIYVTQTPGTLSVLSGDKTTPGSSSTFVSVDASDYNPSLAVEGDRIFVGQFPHDDENGWLAVFASDGGALGVYDTGGNYTRGLGVAGGSAYLAAATGDPNTIRSIPTTGGTYSEISDPFGTYSYTNVSVDDAGVAWVTAAHDVGYFDRDLGAKSVDLLDSGIVNSVALGATSVYAAIDPPDSGADAGSIVAVARSGGAGNVVAAAQDHPRQLHACPTLNVWLSGDDLIFAQAR